MSARTLRLRFLLWSLLMAGLLGVYYSQVWGQLRLQTNILAVLPEVERDRGIEAAAQALSATSGRRLSLLLGARQFSEAQAAAMTAAELLQRSALFDTVQLVYEARQIDSFGLPSTVLPLLMSDAQRRRLGEDGAGALVSDTLRSLHSPKGWSRIQPFLADPFGFGEGFFLQSAAPAGRLQLRDGVLHTRYDNRDYVALFATFSDDPFSLSLQQRAAPVFDTLQQTLHTQHPESELLMSGVWPHAAANTQRATAEVSTFGTVSLAGILLVVLLAFRSLRPLLLSLASLGAGAVAALTACHFLFAELHLVTLVFGSTLFGVGIDYSIHYFCDQFRYQGDWPRGASLAHVGPAILIGMLATVLGYQAFLLPPFPGLRQMAVFSVVGVATACACVLLWYPLLASRRPATHRPLALRWAEALEQVPLRALLHQRWTGVVLLLLVAVTAGGLWKLDFVDDIRALQSAPAAVVDAEQRAQRIIGMRGDTRFFLVRAATGQDVLVQEEALRENLDALVAAGALDGYSAFSRSLPSRARLQAQQQLLTDAVYGPGGAWDQLASALELGAAERQAERDRFAAATVDAPEPAAWVSQHPNTAAAVLWLGAVEGRPASAVTLHGIQDLAAVQAAAAQLEGVHFVDRVASISSVMQRYRHLASACLFAAYLLIGAALMFRYGPAVGAGLLMAPLGAAALTLATLGWLGAEASLFNILALVLVLGLGVDYAVFMREGLANRATAIMAIGLAGSLTLLAFGMLSFSATPFIRSVGLTVLFGVSYTFVLALLCAAPATGDNGAPPILKPST